MQLNRLDTTYYISGNDLSEIASKFSVKTIIVQFEYVALRRKYTATVDFGQVLPTDNKGRAFKPYITYEIVPNKDNRVEANSIGAFISLFEKYNWEFDSSIVFEEQGMTDWTPHIFKYKE